MDLASLHPLYEHPGPWASAYADTPRRTRATPTGAPRRRGPRAFRYLARSTRRSSHTGSAVSRTRPSEPKTR
ncbi:hypothetical protein SM007_24730 [Streptomyces avermitilis]|uniref:Uncharacterized protein n=1 Tax=Streptomyces avermitilis TaxID=33903 RepID=A0A4D4LV07_STRAX|nr:hypothetical protein [Streptomyces sp. SID5469]OOV25585.1 hypothetical protein SM007_24730 [Streptomyces avermitilis]BBJ49607.1 hypothetical protein SAVMC3_22360 [Streptomyces avermitilis]GDY61629.1 hypothetical protein SAV14893_010220 [Streptomyces avermitilis]GDY78265.1 hypothetical protein SAV31267_077500 [Streptomyces avermitilis]